MQVPPDGTTCGALSSGFICLYSNEDQCVCDPNVDQWRCLDCPLNLPSSGGSCTGFYGRTCAYQNARCSCNTTSDNWDCVSCPASQPAENSSCVGLPRLSCQYGSGRCICNGASLLWTCN